MYVLDEVDAALDLSHTQNIGHLLRTRFRGSQFIVVSLKEGMFQEANVLFKAKFREGTSWVERHTQKGTQPSRAAAPMGKENVAPAGAARPAAKSNKRKAAARARDDDDDGEGEGVAV
jgi:structural maintenance of chromosome 2